MLQLEEEKKTVSTHEITSAEYCRYDRIDLTTEREAPPKSSNSKKSMHS